ncbi:MAG TPA: SBBP repeat-containing protein [Pyrinomonadaceae bacterium]|nr:SBBP repeat-containing protein [Pyrinomonadaceae bacterium]
MSYARHAKTRSVETLVVAAMMSLIFGLVLPGLTTRSAAKSHGESNSTPNSTNAENLDAKLSGETYGRIPLSFEVNEGQTDRQVQFLSRGAGYTIFLTPTKAVLSLQQQKRGSTKPVSNVLRIALVGANQEATVAGIDQLPGKSNYFIGNDPKKWQINVPTFARVSYQNIYHGVDLVYYGNQRQLENDFVVAPGADPNVIDLAFDGSRKVSIDEAGNLSLQTDAGQVRLQKPVIYQLLNGRRQEVAGNYLLRDQQTVGFHVAAYDHSAPLVIDPVVVFSSSLLDGGGNDTATAIAVDSNGNAYVTGDTASANFPTVNPLQPALSGAQDAFISKFNSTGSALVYSTYLGGNTGFENGWDIVVDSGGNAYVAGRTTALDFPVTAGSALQPTKSTNNTVDSGFVTRLSATGALFYSTYLTGPQGSSAFGIATDGSGNAYVTGRTGSGFPVTASAFSSTTFNTGFLTKINTNASGAASLAYSTFLGPTGFAEGHAITADANGNAYITGNTNSTSTNFTSAGAAQTTFGGGTADAFVAKFNTNLSGAASRVYSTYLGGSGQDFGGQSTPSGSKAIAIDGAGNAFVTGFTTSTNFPTANAFQGASGGNTDAFLTKVNAAGSALIYSTYFGGNGSSSDEGRSVAVNLVGNAYVVGLTNSANFPTASPLSTADGTTGGAFLAKFTPTGTPLVYSTRFGAVGEQGLGLALDGAGNAFVTSDRASSTFVAEIADPTIIGRVIDEDQNPIPGATVNLTGVPAGTTTTDANGFYTFGLLTAGNNYTVSVNVPNYIFNSQTVNGLAKNVRLDFSPVVISISGQVTLGSSGLGSVTMTLSGGKSLNTATDGSGNYVFANLPAGRDYTVTPAKPSFGFEPTLRTFTNTLANQIANFVASATFQFSVGSYVASETTGFAVITIQRTSGASGPASVDYATSNGTASQRTDYTISIGRLNFATDETSKNFRVPIIDDLYVEGDETINITLSNPVGATLGTPNPAQVTVTDNDGTTATTNPLDNADARFFVRQHYLDFLNRVPDQGGFDFWSAKITVCGSDQACIRANRVGVSNSFFFELEYQQTGSYVQRLYRESYGNNQPFPNTQTDPNFPNEEKKMPNYSVFSQDRALVIGGSNLAQKQLDLANAFVLRPEFLAKYPATLSTAGQFVDAVLATIQTDSGVNMSGERNNLITLYNSLGRGGVMYRLADDNTGTNPINNRAFIDAEYNRSFVLGEYFGYLRRNPDIGGFVFWLNQVNSGALRDVSKQSAMVCSFITSAEYQLRFSPVATRNNTECP